MERFGRYRSPGRHRPRPAPVLRRRHSAGLEADPHHVTGHDEHDLQPIDFVIIQD
jgi:hypothetical protein